MQRKKNRGSLQSRKENANVIHPSGAEDVNRNAAEAMEMRQNRLAADR
jgi:hypothetical protein